MGSRADEGQRLTAELLEVIRALLNFETYEDKLLQIVVAGTLELRDRILAKKNKALWGRVFAPCLFTNLGPSETAEMIQFRCDRFGIEETIHRRGGRADLRAIDRQPANNPAAVRTRLEHGEEAEAAPDIRRPDLRRQPEHEHTGS